MPEPSVLLVDDEKFFLDLQRDFLGDSPVTVLTATAGREAFDLARTHRPRLIFMDYRMPEMDGAACCALLKTDPRLCRIPVIMVVGEGKVNDRRTCREAGCDALITKPLDRKEFLAIGRRFLPEVERRQPRVPCGTLTVFRRAGDSFHGTVEDVSLCGVYVASRCEVCIDETIRLGFMLPGTDFLEADARVAWINQGHRRIKKSLPEGFGVEFVDIPAAAADLVKRFVEGRTPR